MPSIATLFCRYGDADPAFRNFIRPCQHNGRSFKCLSLQQREMHSIRERFYSDASKVNQDVRLCHMLSAEPVRRRRSQGLIEQKKMTVSYFLKKRNGESIRVCQKIFTAVLGITKHRTNTVAKVILEGGTPREKRGGDRVSNKTEDKKNLVRNFIKKLKGRESHYNRKKSRRMYLSANLSIARLRKMFNHQNEAANWVSYNMFRNIFVNEFNIGFSSPASDVCGKCARIKEQYKTETNIEKKRQLITEYRVHRKRASAFYELAKETPEGSLSFCFDLQQVQPLPRTPVGDAFYAHQISFYAFCCVGMSSRNPTFYVWTEDAAGRGSTEVGSALLCHLDTLDYADIHQIRLFCDGCAGQNKNSHVVHTLMFWLANKAPENVREIIITFPVRGHSFMAADRCFGRVERILRKHPVITTTEEYIDLYSEVGGVKKLGYDWKIYDIKELETRYKKVKGIADTKRIQIQRGNNRCTQNAEIRVTTHEYYRIQSTTNAHQTLLKKGKEQDIHVVLKEVKLRNTIPEKKKKSLSHLMNEAFGTKWSNRPDLEWYKNLLLPVDEVREEDDNIEPCDCLHEEAAVLI